MFVCILFLLWFWGKTRSFTLNMHFSSLAFIFSYSMLTVIQLTLMISLSPVHFKMSKMLVKTWRLSSSYVACITLFCLEEHFKPGRVYVCQLMTPSTSQHSFLLEHYRRQNIVSTEPPPRRVNAPVWVDGEVQRPFEGSGDHRNSI